VSENNAVSPAGNGLDPFAQRHFLRNSSMIALENTGFVIAITFVGSTTVLPTFVTRLGGSAFMVGLIATCQTAGWLLPQLLGAGLTAGKARILPNILIPIYVGRPALLVVAAIIAIFGTSAPWLLLLSLYLAILVFYGTDGIASVPWFELVAKTVPPDRRGRLFGTAQIAGGLGGMGVGALVAVILGSPVLGFPNSYMLLFLISGFLFLLNYIPFWLVREPVSDTVAAKESARPTVREFGASLLRIVRSDRTFVQLLASRLLMGTGMAAFPFYILFMDEQLSVSAERLGLFTSAQVLGGLIGGLAIGWIADHRGPRTVIRLSAIICAGIPLIALLMLPLHSVLAKGFVLAGAVLFVILGGVNSTNVIGFMNYLMEIAPLEQRTLYVGLFSTLAGIILVVPPLLGLLLQAASFQAVFLLAMLASIGSFLVSLGLRKPVRVK
jgi:MFS family permease